MRKILRKIYHGIPLPLAIKQKIRKNILKPWRMILFKLHYYYFRFKLARFPLMPAKQDLPDIFFFSIIDWHFRLQRPQHLAKALAERGHRVFYFTNKFYDANKPYFQSKQLSENLPIYLITLALKNSPEIYGHNLTISEQEQLKLGMANCLLWTGTRRTLAIVQHPFWYELAYALPNSNLIYDCMDHHAGFIDNAPAILEKERALAINSDLILVSAKKLLELMSPLNNRIVMIRNAADYEHFSRVPSQIYRDKEQRTIIGYYGAIAEWFDVELIAKIAAKFTNSLILLIGTDTANVQTQLKQYKNIIFTGEIPYAKLPEYLYAFDVCLIPFKITPLTEATNPVKVYEYLAAGRPVISVDLPEVQEMSSIVCVAKSHDEFIQFTGQELQNKNNLAVITQRQDFAKEQTWAARAIQFDNALPLLSEPMVSIVVLTYNNIDLTKACLNSLDQYTDYANYEVLIVDNASSDGTPDYLKSFCAEHSRYRAILNSQNLGFSAGNNCGLKEAKGEYLVLLNNDTQVTPGWLRTLVNHMRRDKTIGLIGPITNNIGNEAKVPTRYIDPKDMLSEVQEIALKNMGKTLPMYMAAFFCVMFTREVFNKVGLMDENFGLGYFEDDDYCRRVAQHGYKIACARDVFVHHQWSASFSKLTDDKRWGLFEKNKLIYEKKWGKWVPPEMRTKQSEVDA